MIYNFYDLIVPSKK